jgi:plastocyanin
MWKFLPSVSLALSVALAAASCGGGDSPSSPTPAPAPAPTPNPSTVTITISSSGASPRSVTIAAGGRVTFVNNDTRPHDMSSDPHPEHTDCPPMRDVGLLSPGQSKTSGNFTAARTCGFHDHIEPSNTSLQGTIIIQ